jgi:hypothetical protein
MNKNLVLLLIAAIVVSIMILIINAQTNTQNVQKPESVQTSEQAQSQPLVKIEEEAPGETTEYVTGAPSSDSIAGFYYPDMGTTYFMLSVSADGTFADVYYDYTSKEFKEDPGKWTLNPDGTYLFLPDDEIMKELGVKTYKKAGDGVLVVVDMEEWRMVRQSLESKFPGFSPISNWIVRVGDRLDNLYIYGDKSYRYCQQLPEKSGNLSKLNGGSFSCAEETKWFQKGNYIYIDGQEEPVIGIEGTKMFFLGHGGKIEMERTH